MCVCTCVHIRRSEVNVGCLQCFPAFILRQCQSLNLNLDDGQQVRWGSKHSPDLASVWAPCFHNQVLMLMWQACYWLCQLSSPYFSYFFLWNNASLCSQGWPKTMLLRLVLNLKQASCPSLQSGRAGTAGMCHHAGLSSRWLLESLKFPHGFHDMLPAQECMDLHGRDGHDLLRPPSPLPLLYPHSCNLCLCTKYDNLDNAC